MKKNIFKKFIVLLSLVIILFGHNFVFAEELSPALTTNIHLKIISSETSLYDSDISVNTCDSDNNIETPNIATPYCAILQSKVSSVWDWSWAPGAFVTSVGGIAGYTSKDKENNDVYHYWSWSLNGSEAMTGLNQYELKLNDSILLEFIDPIEEIVPEVEVPVSRHSSSGSVVGSYVNTNIIEKTFSVTNALEFLLKNQKSDGSYDTPMHTDWVAIAMGAENNQTIKLNLINYLKSNSINSSIITDNERRAMALMALNIDPYIGTNVNYIKKITDSFDGKQFGDSTLLNDDIFALIVLKNAGYNENDEIILKDINYIISKQNSDGSWGGVDITSASIQALRGFENITEVSNSILNGENYLISKQEDDGGFGNSFSTSWVLQSLFKNNQIVISEKYLAEKQQLDGGLENTNDDNSSRVWATSYAIPAILHKPWSDILNNFSKPIVTENLTSTKEVENKKEILTKKVKIIENKKEDLKNFEKKEENLVEINNASKEKIILPVINNILSTLKYPFVWLWGHLGF